MFDAMHIKYILCLLSMMTVYLKMSIVFLKVMFVLFILAL